MTPKAIIHLLSGGMDSVVLMHDLINQGHSVHALMINYGQKHVRELECARNQCMRTGTLFTEITIPTLRGSKLTDGIGSDVVPNRNGIFISLAANLAAVANADTITIGCNADDSAAFQDCRPGFISAINSAIRFAGYNVEVCAPYMTKKKWEIADLGRQMGVSLYETWSCYSGMPIACGKCDACMKRINAIESKWKSVT